MFRVRAVRRPAALCRSLRERDRLRVADTTLVRELRVQDDQARLVDVGDVRRILRADVDAREVPTRPSARRLRLGPEANPFRRSQAGAAPRPKRRTLSR
jgi:hypothetical protein